MRDNNKLKVCNFQSRELTYSSSQPLTSAFIKTFFDLLIYHFFKFVQKIFISTYKLIQRLKSDLETTKRELNKYKQICKDPQPDSTATPQHQSSPNRPLTQKTVESPQITARQTIPSERANLDQQMKKYDKQNKRINVVKLCQKNNKDKEKERQRQRERPSINLSNQLSSLNVSKSTVNFFGEISSPSVSSLSYRPDEGVDDLSFNFSGFQKKDYQHDRNL